MEGSTENWRVKHSKNWLSGKNDRGDDNMVKDDNPKTRKDPKKKKDDVTLVFCSKKKKTCPARCKSKGCESSMLSIVTSLNNNCCLCCGAFARYLQAVWGCVSCLAFCHIPKLEFERLFCELIEAAGEACYDLLCLIWKFFHICARDSK